MGKNKKKTIFLILAVLIFTFDFLVLKNVLAASTDDVSGWAWSENVGWLSFNCIDRGICATSNYGVNVDKNGKFSGYAWFNTVPETCLKESSYSASEWDVYCSGQSWATQTAKVIQICCY